MGKSSHEDVDNEMWMGIPDGIRMWMKTLNRRIWMKMMDGIGTWMMMINKIR